MFKLFWKSIFITFGWFIVFVNIVMFFNMTSIFANFTGAVVGDTSDKYFGVSTLINAFKGLGSTPFAKFTQGFKSFVDSIFKFANSLYTAGYPTFLDNNNFWDFISDILNVLKNLLGYVFSIYVVVFGTIVSVAYVVLLIINILYTLFMFLGGYYLNDVPTSTILDSIGHCMTPLLQCYPLWVGV